MKLDLSPFVLAKEDIERSVVDLRTEVLEQAARKVAESNERNVEAAVILELTRRCKELEAKLSVVESQRPHWAKGYSTDSIAAQVSGGALSELWELVGVSNQTDAVEKLQRMVAMESQEPAVAVPADMLLISRESLEQVRDTLEFWINREDRRGMSESDYKTWLSLGHRSKGMTILREALAKRTLDTDRCPSHESEQS